MNIHERLSMMREWQVLRKVHHVGSPIKGTVLEHGELTMQCGVPGGSMVIQAGSEFPASLPYAFLVDEFGQFTPQIIPEVGSQIDTVVFNFVDEQLILNAQPKSLQTQAVERWRQYYEYIDTLEIGGTIQGVVERSMPFGLFVDVDGPFKGLIERGLSDSNGGVALPQELSDWPMPGETINCSVGVFRLHCQQLGLGWFPPRA